MEDKGLTDIKGLSEIRVTLSEEEVKEAIRLYLLRFNYEVVDNNYQIGVKTESRSMGLFSKPIIRHYFGKSTVSVKTISMPSIKPTLKTLSKQKEDGLVK